MREDWIELDYKTVVNKISTNNKKLKQKEYLQKGVYPVIDQGQDLVGGYTDDETKLLDCELPVIVFGDHTKIVKLINFRFAPGADGTKVLEPKKFVLPKYLSYLTQILVFKIKDKGYARHYQHIEKQTFPIAPLPEQRAIVAKIEKLFSELDNGIANLKAAKDKLEIYRQAVLKKAFEGELTREWREQNPYSEKDLVELLEYIEDFNANKSGQDIPRRLPPIDLSDLQELPYGWIWQESHKICSSVRDGTHDTPKYVDEGVPLVTSKNLKSGEIDMDNVDLISESDHEEICRRSAVEENDILYGMIGTIGNPVIVKETNAFSIKNVGLFKKNEMLLVPKYFQYYLSSWVVEHIMRQKELIRGTTQKFVALGGLRVLPIPLPSIKEQEQIIYEIESRLSVCDNILANIEEGLEKSEALRQSILKQAFEGKLLSEDELEACRKEADWEPAEKLLERIKSQKGVQAHI